VMVKRPKLPRFTGELNKPIVERLPLLYGKMAEAVWGADLEKVRERELHLSEMRVRQRRKEKLSLLVEHYKIGSDDPRRWFYLSLLLACDFVPGMRTVFKEPPKRGRRATRKAEWFALIEAINDIRAKRGVSVRQAIRTMRHRHARTWGLRKPNTLETRYYEALKALKRP